VTTPEKIAVFTHDMIHEIAGMVRESASVQRGKSKHQGGMATHEGQARRAGNMTSPARICLDGAGDA